MRRWLWILAMAVPTALAACGDGGGDPPEHTVGPFDVPAADVPRPDTASPDAFRDPGAGDDADRESPGTDEGAPGDGTAPDEAPEDPGAAPDPGPGDDGPADPGPSDPGAGDAPPVEPFCRSYADCADGEACEFSLGRCQGRSTWIDAALGLYGFHPQEGAPGDVLVVDGARFHAGSLGVSAVRVKIGSVQVGGWSVTADENRLWIPVTAKMQGAVTVYDAENHVATLAGPFRQAPAGVIACDGSTPAGTGVPGDAPTTVGPYAAGYADIAMLQTRIFYPALCGSIRRPPVPGTWPLVVILHGNGALHLNHEHLAQLLATWGFLSVMPSTMNNMANQDQEALVAQAMPLVQAVRAADLGALHPVLAGVSTTPEVVWVGHSRGTGRAEELVAADPDLEADTRGAVFLGPVDDGLPLPGLLLVFGGGKDAQSGTGSYVGPYNDHDGPAWLVELPGGNHGSFCDHKVYGYGGLGWLGDAQPAISRHRQLMVVQSYALPLVQRAFGVDEPFAGWLDDPPAAADHTVKHHD